MTKLTPWVLESYKKLHLVYQQLDAAQRILDKANTPERIDLFSASSLYVSQISDLLDELSLGRVLDTSDLVLHAEGTSVANKSPWLSAFNNICNNVQQQLSQLAMSAYSLNFSDRLPFKNLKRGLDFRFNGIAPGSLYLGFSLDSIGIDDAEIKNEEQDHKILDLMRSSIKKIPIVPKFVGDESFNIDGFSEVVPDPAMRDATMEAAAKLTPTGRFGIHTIEVSSPSSSNELSRDASSLSQRERVILNAAIKDGVRKKHSSSGKFTGRLRALDLDGMIVVSDISDDIKALRVKITPEQAHSVKGYIGRPVTVEGSYENDKDGRPRLMHAQKVSPMSKDLPL